jgi:hypothetical protein
MVFKLKSFLFLSLSTLFSATAFAASTFNPATSSSFDAVVGTYKLLEAKSGACPDTLWINKNLIRESSKAAEKLEVSVSFSLLDAQLLYQLQDFNAGSKTTFSSVPFAPWANASTTTQADFDGTRLTASARSISTYLFTFGALHWRNEMLAEFKGDRLTYSYEWMNNVAAQNYAGQCVFEKSASN